MSLARTAQYHFMKDLGAPALMALQRRLKGKKKPRPRPEHFGPPLKCAGRLKEIMTRHYLLARYAKGARPVAWVTSGAPVELLRVFGFYTVYPENHGALCGAQRMGPEICAAAEDAGYHPDLCSYARIDLGHALSGKTPAGRLPRPDLLFASTNICQTVLYWYKALAHYWGVPLLLLDTPYNFGEITDADLDYMAAQLKEMIPELERLSGRSFSRQAFQEKIGLAAETSGLWGRVLATMQNRPAPMGIFDAFVHLAPVVSLRGLKVSHDYYRLLLDELEERVAEGIGAVVPERKRLMWDNIAVWYKLRDWSQLFAQRGLNFVAATYTNAWAETIQHLDPDRPFRSMAKTYSLVILNNNLNHRLELMAQMVRDYRVDGLVVHSARSCKPYSVGQYDLARLLRERLGIPSVIIEADITDYRVFSEEQANTRLEAFFESLGV
jgi:bcr-type benzoyl-CoA reductase subunit B